MCVCVCCREASTHGSAESPAAPNSASWVFILAKGVNRMLMCATSELCVCVSRQCALFLHRSVCDICRK